MIIWQKARQPALGSGRLRRWTLRLALPAGLLALLGVVFVAGYAANESGYAREFLRVTLISLQHHTNYVKAVLANDDLPNIRIDMKMSHLRTLEENRNDAVKQRFMLGSDVVWVPAKLTLDDTSMRVKMRLKGILNDHRTTRKWSFRINVRGDQSVLGMRRFSIQHPATRDYLIEWCYLQTLRAEEVLAPRYGFLEVVFNGTSKGIYAFEEHVGKELLESQRRRDGVILKIDDTDIWMKRILNGRKISSVFPSSYNNAEIQNYAENRTARDPLIFGDDLASVR